MKLAFLQKSIILVCELVLTTVFGYTGLIKLVDFQEWDTKYNQLDFVHDFHLKWGLYAIPIVEVLIALMYFFEKGKKAAAWSSFFLMLSFTIYIYYKIYVWQ